MGRFGLENVVIVALTLHYRIDGVIVDGSYRRLCVSRKTDYFSCHGRHSAHCEASEETGQVAWLCSTRVSPRDYDTVVLRKRMRQTLRPSRPDVGPSSRVGDSAGTQAGMQAGRERIGKARLLLL